jgi:acetyl-CoA synthetase
MLLSELKHELGETPLSPERRFTLVASSGDVLKPRHISFAARTLVETPERVVNLWIQTECGASIISTFPSAELNRPGTLGLPFPGIMPLVVNYLGQACRPNESGQLVFSASWPSMIRTIWGQADRFRQLYFRRVPGYYGTNDGVRVDGEEFYWFMGRLDDAIKVRGQLLATSDIEAVLVAHPLVSEAVVVSVEAEDGEMLVAFLVLDKSIMEKSGAPNIAELKTELARSIEQRVGEFTVISEFIVAPELPRTRTGKIMRRVLKRIAVGDISGDEDLSHLANPGTVDELIRKRGL